MTTRRAQGVAAVAATVVIVLNATSAAHAAPTRGAALQEVVPGQSIQAAIDHAATGGEIDIMPGTFRGSLRITTPGLRIRGAGAGTVIVPSAGHGENSCARAGHGICVTGTAHRNVSGVSLHAVTVSGFKKNGVDASYADRLHVSGVTVSDNGEQGISEERSLAGVFQDDTALRNGQAGIFIANTVSTEAGALDTKGTRVTGNRLSANRFGVVLRRVRDLTVESNLISGNCGGVFVVGDENVPRAGDLAITGNQVLTNNKHCASNGRLPVIDGTGILLTGTDHARVTGNQVVDNGGPSPMSGGIVLYGSNVGVHNTDNKVSGNIVIGNGPADLAVRDSKGSGNTFSANTCGAALPATAGRCG